MTNPRGQLADLPDYTHANPWQRQTIDTCAPIEVVRPRSLDFGDARFVHLSWEDAFLAGCKSEEEACIRAESCVARIGDLAKRARLAWTLHNETSHFMPFRRAEAILREGLKEFSHVIFLMSRKHMFLIEPPFRDKVVVLPHYICPNPYPGVARNGQPTLFRYGVDRGETRNELYLELLNDEKIGKFVSDARLDSEVTTETSVVVNRRFTQQESWLYARLANFALFFRAPKLNSGVLNFYLGNGLVVLHDAESVRYADLPEFYDAFRIDPEDAGSIPFQDYFACMADHAAELDRYIAERSPRRVSQAFWDALLA